MPAANVSEIRLHRMEFKGSYYPFVAPESISNRKFIDRQGTQATVYTTFMDEMREETEIVGLVQADPKLKNYRLRVERFIRDHETHPTIHRIKTNQPFHARRADLMRIVLA